MPQGKANQRRPRAPKRTIHVNRDISSAGEELVLSKRARLIEALPIPQRASINGKVLVCGLGVCGQLGLGSNIIERCHLAILPNITDVVEVCAGGMHTLVLTSDGLVYSFGCNDDGALGRDTSEEDSEFEPSLIKLPQKAVMISVGDSHSACILENGCVMAWGSFRDSQGDMGLTLEGRKSEPYSVLPGKKCCNIASGSNHLAVLTCSGHVYTVGCAEQGQLGRIAVRSASGKGRRGKTDMLRPHRIISRRFKLVDAIWATNYCTFLRESDTGKIFAFGLNNYRQLAYPKGNVVPIPVLCDWDNVKSIAGGEHHTMVLKNDGSVHVIGRWEYGRLGLGEIQEDATTLTLVEQLNGKFIVSIACGETTSFAVTEAGEVYSWGSGNNNQLGMGNEDDVLIPTFIESKEIVKNCVVQVSSGGQHSVFLVQQTVEN